MVVYSDGSHDGNKAGASYCVYRGRSSLVSQGKIPLSCTAEVFDAEAIAALEGLRAAIANPMSRYATNLTICLDNEEVAIHLQAKAPTASSFQVFKDFQKACMAWDSRERAGPARTSPGTLNIHWCLGHQGIQGNKIADRLVKEVCNLPTARRSASIARAKTWAKTQHRQAMEQYWDKEAPERYRNLNIRFKPGPPSELKLPRAALSLLLAARSGHGDFAAYHLRFNHLDAELKCDCGADKSPKHFLHCHRIQRSARLTRPPTTPQSEISRWVLGTPEGATAFAKWSLTSTFFRSSNPHLPTEAFRP